MTALWKMAGPLLLLSLSRPALADDASSSTAGEKTRAAEKGTAKEKAANAPGKAPQQKVQSGSEVVETQESAEGVKTYRFGAVEVEGRLRSPQILYFLRRVRAEFAAGDLGHRSFLLELADTQRHPSFK